MQYRDEIYERLKGIGFTYVAIDLKEIEREVLTRPLRGVRSYEFEVRSIFLRQIMVGNGQWVTWIAVDYLLIT